MKKIIFSFLLLVCLSVYTEAGRVYTSQNLTFDNTAAGNTVTFTNGGNNISASRVYVCNWDATNKVYVNFDVLSGSAADPAVDNVSVVIRSNGSCFSWNKSVHTFKIPSINIICAAASCTGVDIYAAEEVIDAK